MGEYGERAFMVDASGVYAAWLKAFGIREGYEQGRMAMALDLVTTMRLVEDMGENGETSLLGLNSDTVVSVLTTFLVQRGILEEAVRLYEELHEWRKTRFEVVADPNVGSIPYLLTKEQAEAVDAEAMDAEGFTISRDDASHDAGASDGEAHR